MDGVLVASEGTWAGCAALRKLVVLPSWRVLSVLIGFSFPMPRPLLYAIEGDMLEESHSG